MASRQVIGVPQGSEISNHYPDDARPKPNGQPFHVKVTSIAIRDAQKDGTEPNDASLNVLPLTTLSFTSPNAQAFRSEITLKVLRSELKQLIHEDELFKFCTTECSTVADELSLDAYMGLLGRAADSDAVEVFVTAFKAQQATSSSALAHPPFLIKFVQSADKGAFSEGSLHSSAFKNLNATGMHLGEMRKMIKKMSHDPEVHTFCSIDGTAVGDEITLGQYLNLDNLSLAEDHGIPSIEVFFRKSGSAKVAKSGGSKSHGASPEVLAALEQLKPDLSFKDRSQDGLKMDTSDFNVQEQLEASQFAAHEANPAKFTGQMDESDWNQVLRNCSLLYGWKIDKKANKVVRATTPAFKLRDNIIVSAPPPSDESVEPASDGPKPAILTPPSRDGSESGSEAEIAQGSRKVISSTRNPAPPTADDLGVSAPVKPGATPSYVINDNSRIEVATVSHEFQKSMAENHFSSSSFEASVSGGYAGFSVGVSGGMASESAKGNTQSSKTLSKTMVATYKFPRVSIFLRPEDMEPTQELQKALELVRKTKNINALRKLHATFGHLFCPEATLGGCLQTTKIITGKEETQQSVEKESFKASVGLAVSTPVGVGGSMKASHETQDSKDYSQKSSDTQEAMVFEATGGNTILAADPPAWSSSVTDFNNWRVINQEGLTPLADVIAQIPGYSAVKLWFLKAVPKLSEYIVIPESRILNVRFKALADNSLSRLSGKAETAYLGHNPDSSLAPRPIRRHLERQAPLETVQRNITQVFPFGMSIDLTTTTTQIDVSTSDTLFFPHSTQAPVLMFPGLANGQKTTDVAADGTGGSNVVTNDVIGTTGDGALMHTVWRLEVPEKYSLGSDCLICIKSLADKSKPVALTVYRNQQGVFLPTMTSTDEPSYWRVERVASMSSDVRIKDGDEIRLCWRFSDQVSGFRDYCDDLYGRRRFQRPAECEYDSLYFKVPYPCFENVSGSAGIAMVMSPANVKEPIVHSMRVLPTKYETDEQVVNYSLHDVRFRLDSVGNDGLGDAADYMNIVSAARTEAFQANVKINTEHLVPEAGKFANKLLSGGPEAVIAGCILGPVAAPIAGLASVLGSIFDF